MRADAVKTAHREIVRGENMKKANFTAGPAVLPRPVEEKLRRATHDFAGTGLPVWSISHRHPVVEKFCSDATALVCELLKVPKGYSVMFVPGGATTQFKGWLLNIVGRKALKIGYVDSGHWAGEAIKAARELTEANFCTVHMLATSKEDMYRSLPADMFAHDSEVVCIHYTSNETVNGTQIKLDAIPDGREVIRAADMTSDIMSRPVPVEKFGLIYAGVQKNLGVPGLALVIVRDDLLDAPHPALPAPLSYAEQKKANGGLRNTPDILAIASVHYILEWIKEAGGVAEMEKRSRERAALLYDAIDHSDVFACISAPADRSLMNVIFRVRNEHQHEKFMHACEESDIVGINGHAGANKYYGPHLRASLYNGQTMENVQRLLEVMHKFERRF
ncbi:3-phosphoserine/phosphohydroxythreonine transaminase [Candidatus Kaiserbacteria bacterium]|nr:3-phosphoserine/phosphohydroxythreonine transaminase [Candidatus Kaiserbacteria bacterium]